MKGFLQCLIKHCKNPIKLIKETNLKKAASIYLIGLQPIITMLFLPMLLFTSIYWLNWIGFPLWGPLTTFASLVHGAFSNPLIFYLSLGCFVLGNITWLLCNLPGIIRRGFFNLIKYVYLIFIYWCLQSLGAWRGLIELIIHPHHWHKTPHGYHLKRTPL